MSEIPPEASAGPAYVLRPTARDGARLLRPSGDEWRLRTEPDGFAVAGGEATLTLSLADRGESMVLASPSSGERGRASALLGAREPLPCDILLADGRVFRVVPRLRDQPVFEVRSWEVSGAYLVARRLPDGWEMALTTAGEQLDGADDLALLLAGCLLHAEGLERG